MWRWRWWIPAELFQIIKDDAVKMLHSICQQFGKLNSAHRTGKGQLSFQYQIRVMPKNVQITVQLHSFHILARQCSKSSKLGFISIWTKNFQMYRLNLEKAEEPEIKLPISIGSKKKQEDSRKTSTSASLTMLKLLMVWITTNWKILQEMETPD